MKRIAIGLCAVGLLGGCETAIDMAVGSQIDGVWKGKSYCSWFLNMDATLEVHLAGSLATGKIAYALPKQEDDKVVGEILMASYTVTGAFDAPNLHLALKPESWIGGVLPDKPMKPVDATLLTDGKTMVLPATTGCTETRMYKQ